MESNEDAVTPDILCSVCQVLFRNNVNWRTVYVGNGSGLTLDPSYVMSFKTCKDIHEQADAGCHLCNVILNKKLRSSFAGFHLGQLMEDTRQRVRAIPPEILLLIEIVRVWHFDYEKPFYYIDLYVRPHDGGDIQTIANIALFDDDPSPERLVSSRTTGSLMTLAWIKKQMSVCQAEHNECGSHNAITQKLGRQLPKRLLDLSRCVHTAKVQLVDGVSLPGSTLYATLSHRWGSKPQLLLKSETALALYAGFPLSKIPVLFGDVIHLVLRLGYRYLWIDTLCLKQDDRMELQQQAPLMYLVYSMSDLNISASTSLHDESLYHERNPLLSTDLVINTDWTCFPDKLFSVRMGLNNDPLQEEPILARGWVFQERLLAPRVLHFGRKCVVWECRKLVKSELADPPLPELYGAQRRLWAILEHSVTPRSLIDVWLGMVEQFSTTLTSMENDRLYAIAGLAAILDRLCWDRLDAEIHRLSWRLPSTKLKDSIQRYFAGNWRFGLIRQLAWRTVLNDGTSIIPTRPQQYRAPTWSWASINGSLKFLARPLMPRMLTELVSVDNDPSSKGAFSSAYGPSGIDSGNILVWCNLCEVGIRPRSNSSSADTLILRTNQSNADMSLSPSLYHQQARIESPAQISHSKGRVLEHKHTIALRHEGSRRAIHWDNRCPSVEPNIKHSRLFLMPLILDGHVDLSEKELELLTDELQGLFRTNTNENLHYFLTDPRLRYSDDIERIYGRGHPIYGLTHGLIIIGLLLQPVEGKIGVYNRVGIIEMDHLVYDADGVTILQNNANTIRSAVREYKLGKESILQTSMSDPNVHQISIC